MGRALHQKRKGEGPEVHAPFSGSGFQPSVLFAQVFDEFFVADFAVAGVSRPDLVIDMPGDDDSHCRRSAR
jgi:hypothetical protein